MNWLRKVDWYLQVISVAITLCAIPYMGVFALLFGQIAIGSLQLISGAVHAFSQLPARFRKAINRYWLIVLEYFVISAILYFIRWKTNVQNNFVLVIHFMIIPWLIAFYYLFWYKKLINHIEYHYELEGLVKS